MKNKLFLISTIVLFLTGCTENYVISTQKTNNGYEVKHILTYDGCKLYSTYVDRTIYFVKCSNSTSIKYSCGKNCEINSIVAQE